VSKVQILHGSPFIKENEENAGVAELADALDLGSSGLKPVGVQVPSPAPSIETFCGNNSVVECDLAKVEVAVSNPVSRSILLILCEYLGRKWFKQPGRGVFLLGIQ
jgi:hypothetical protein